jgi:long-subunit fatty acid transport protein
MVLSARGPRAVRALPRSLWSDSPEARAQALFLGIAVALAVSLPTSATGQVLTTVEFSFSNPGARSLGMGGAFAALADDATAAFANPAGLIQLTEPEVSIEGRSWSYSTPYTVGGRAAGQPSGLGIDTVEGPLRGESKVDLNGLSFVSAVYPLSEVSFAFFQHQLLNFEMTQEIQGLFASGPSFKGIVRGPIEKGLFDFEITTRGLAAGFRVGDRLSLGLGLSYFDSGSYFVGDEYLPDDATAESFFGLATFLPERLSHHVRVEIAAGDWGPAAGFLWSVSPSWKLGGFYREGPELELEGVLVAGPVHHELADGQRRPLGVAQWRFPDVYGLGLSYRSPDGHWAAGFEWDRVEYSTILDSLDRRLQDPGDALDDADELHLGGEYAFFVGTSVVAVRLGAWHDPDHQFRNESGGPFFQAENVPGADELHLAAGVGAALGNLQIDLGLDLSERRDTASMSVIYNF